MKNIVMNSSKISNFKRENFKIKNMDIIAKMTIRAQ